MNPVIRAQLRDFSKYNALSAHNLESQFEIYSIFAILSGYLGDNIDPYQIHLPGNEFGLDGVAIVIQGDSVRDKEEAIEKLRSINNPSIEFIFFQSKTGTGYDYGDISKFFDAVEGCFNNDLGGESGDLDDIIDAIGAIYEYGVGKRNPKLSCYYVTTGTYEEPARIEKLKANFSGKLREMNIFDDEGIVVEMVGARQLQQWYRLSEKRCYANQQKC